MSNANNWDKKVIITKTAKTPMKIVKIAIIVEIAKTAPATTPTSLKWESLK